MSLVASTHKTKRRIKVLNFERESIKDTVALALALPKYVALRVLDLNTNKIKCDGAIALAAAIPNCPKLKTLNLRSNQIGDKGAIALAAAVPNCIKLAILDLAKNKIGGTGAIAFAEAIPKTKLDHLNLWNNPISREGSISLQKAVWFSLTHVYERNVYTCVKRNLGCWEMLAFVGARNGSAEHGAVQRFVWADGDRAIQTRILEYLLGG